MAGVWHSRYLQATAGTTILGQPSNIRSCGFRVLSTLVGGGAKPRVIFFAHHTESFEFIKIFNRFQMVHEPENPHFMLFRYKVRILI